MRVIDLPIGWTVVVDCVAWAGAGVGFGYLAHRIPLERLSHDGALTRLRPIEGDGRWYEQRWRIRSWKDRLPEAGSFFAGGFSKRSLRTGRRANLERFVAETRRAERTHWSLLAVAPLFFVWNPWWLGFVMVGYALVANVPCLVVQRYNRARLLRVLARSASRPAR
jgi:glycosyl-4,4'-diaponeurosporenoate acyltransferase